MQGRLLGVLCVLLCALGRIERVTLAELGLLLRQLGLLQVGLRNRVCAKRQHAAELARDTADGAAQAGVAEDAADGAAQRLPDRADQIAQPALGRYLAGLLGLLLLVDGLQQLGVLLLVLLQLLLQLLDLLHQRLLLHLMSLD